MKLACRFGWHDWPSWATHEVKVKTAVELNYQDYWVDHVRRTQERECSECGLRQERMVRP